MSKNEERANRVRRELPEETQGAELTVIPTITAADIDEILSLLPGTEAQLVAMSRYGEKPWAVVAGVREKLVELRKKIEP